MTYRQLLLTLLFVFAVVGCVYVLAPKGSGGEPGVKLRKQAAAK